MGLTVILVNRLFWDLETDINTSKNVLQKIIFKFY